MKKILLTLLVISLTLLHGMTKRTGSNQVDDWEYNATEEMQDSRSMSATMAPAPVPKSMSIAPKKIGLAVGGAKDTENFEANIDNGYLPKYDSITYEGQFYNHFFDTGLKGGTCQDLFCPSYSTAKRINPFSKEEEYFLSVGLNSGINEKDFQRKKLNLVVVLDISGSMGAGFDSYYYDQSGNRVETNEKESKKKMQIATESIVAMLAHLKDDDRAGIVLFDHNAYRAKPLRLVGDTDREAIRDHILELEERGGTDWSAGYEEGVKLFDDITLDPAYENRIVFLTDAMPNRGELSDDKLFGMAKKASEKGIHTTFIGVGVDFNNDLVEYVSKTKGANYFSVHSSKTFKELLDDEFDYMVTPLVYDLTLKLDSRQYDIEGVYGSPEAKLATGEIMKVNTLFPSKAEGDETKGGVVLLKLKKVGSGSDDIKLSVSYTDVNGKSFSNSGSAKFENRKGSYYYNSGIHKAILVSDYVTVMKNWIMDARAGCNDQVKWVMEDYPSIMKRCTVFPPKRPLFPTIKTWERSSCKLKVSEGYQKLFYTFKDYYEKEMNKLNDRSLEKELDILNKLLKLKAEPFDPKPIDDWQFRK